jgi:predicted class III extradiol MEMO1 family dioxygenase
MSVEVQLQPSAFTAFPSCLLEQMRRILCQLPSYLFSIISELFVKSSDVAHYKALNESIISFAISTLRTLVQFPVSIFSLSCLFSSESELIAKKQGGWVGG